MKYIKLIILIGTVLLSVYVINQIINNIKIKNIDYELCMKSSEENIIYECIFKKQLFSPTQYSDFLSKNKNLLFLEENKNVDFLLEYFFMVNFCDKSSSCKLEMEDKKYEELFQCSQKNQYCLNFVIPYNHQNKICSEDIRDKNLFVNETIYQKYITLSNEKKLELCKLSKKRKQPNYMIGIENIIY